MTFSIPNLSEEELLEAVKESMFGMESLGFCRYCGEEATGVEPDAERYECDSCGKRGVYGAEQILLLTVA